jgi:soluble lytic murein transglycosylase-like protein
MRISLQLALMLTVISAAFLSPSTPTVSAQAITSDTDNSGHKVYVNESEAPVSPRRSQSLRPRQNSLIFWSVTDHRWKPVPSVNVRAARSAAAEVHQYLAGNTEVSVLPTSTKTFTPQEIDAAINQAALRHNVDPSLVRAVIKVESNFNPNAVSRKGAMGLMQLMPQTARQLNVSNPFDPEQNVDAGVRHLKRLMESYGGDVRLTLAAYNAGSGAVARSAGVPHFPETINYVNRISELYARGTPVGARLSGGPVREPVRVQRDSRGVLYISNTD